ncbi:hypothetical protein WA158_002730 [Blastocystis sp. Blastoise]
MKPERKMQLKDFVKLNKSYGELNKGKELPEEFLKDIYKSIASEQILTSEESSITSNVLRPEQWANIMRLSRTQENKYLVCHKKEDFIEDVNHKEFQAMYDRDIFSIIWPMVLSSAGALLEATDDRYSLEYARDGFITCAHIASHYNMNVIMDEIITLLSKYSSLPTEYIDSQNINNPIHFVYRLGSKPSCQMSLVTLFGVIRKLPNDIQKSWDKVLQCIIHLFFLGLLPSALYRESDVDFITPVERQAFYSFVFNSINTEAMKSLDSNLVNKLLSWNQQQIKEDLSIQKLPLSPVYWFALFSNNLSLLQSSLSIVPLHLYTYKLPTSITNNTNTNTNNTNNNNANNNNNNNNSNTNNTLSPTTAVVNATSSPVNGPPTDTRNTISTKEIALATISALPLELEKWLKQRDIHNDKQGTTITIYPNEAEDINTDTIIDNETGDKQHIFLAEVAFECINKCRLDIFIEQTTNWSGVTLDLFTKAILKMCKTPYQMDNRVAGEPYNSSRVIACQFTKVFCIQLLTEILIKNKERYTLVWPDIQKYIDEVFKSTESASLEVDKLVEMIFRLCIYIINDEQGEDLLLCLSHLLMINRDCFIAIAPQITSGLYQLFLHKGIYISSQGHWAEMQKIIDACANLPNTTLHYIFTNEELKQCIPISFASTLTIFIQTTYVSATMVMDILDYCFCLHNNIMCLLQSETNEDITWTNSWFSVLRTVTTACNDKRVQVRMKALKALDSMLLDHRTNLLNSDQWCNCILHVLHPTLKDILMDIVGVKENPNSVLRYRVSRIPANPVVSLALVVMVNILTYRLESIVMNENFYKIWDQTLSIFQFVESISVKESTLMKENERLLLILLKELYYIGVFNLGEKPFASEFWKLTESVLTNINADLNGQFITIIEEEEKGEKVETDPVHEHELPEEETSKINENGDEVDSSH